MMPPEVYEVGSALARRLADDPGAAPYVRLRALELGVGFDLVVASADLLRRERFAAEVRAALGAGVDGG